MSPEITITSEELRERVEDRLDRWIPDDVWNRAEPYARHKNEVNRQRHPEIDYYDNDYLVLLTADTVRETEFSDLTHALCDLTVARAQRKEKPMETTKERAARCDRATHARRSSSLPAYGSRTASITRRRRRAKRKALRAATLAAAVLLLGGISVAIFTTPAGSKQETNILPPTATVVAYIPDTPAPAAETVEPTEPAVRYPLTDTERDTVERVVMAEAGGESFEGQMLVAQCILNAAEKRGVDPSEAVVLYSYTKSRPDPTQRVKDAVAAVFDRGETVVDEPILYFYNPALVTSDFHESQIFVIEEGGHRFFAERSTR